MPQGFADLACVSKSAKHRGQLIVLRLRNPSRLNFYGLVADQIEIASHLSLICSEGRRLALEVGENGIGGGVAIAHRGTCGVKPFIDNAPQRRFSPQVDVLVLGDDFDEAVESGAEGLGGDHRTIQVGPGSRACDSPRSDDLVTVDQEPAFDPRLVSMRSHLVGARRTALK